MKVFEEVSLIGFKFWSGAIDNANSLTYEQMEQVEAILDDCYPEGISATQLNDLFWFDFETIQEWLGINEEEGDF